MAVKSPLVVSKAPSRLAFVAISLAAAKTALSATGVEELDEFEEIAGLSGTLAPEEEAPFEDPQPANAKLAAQKNDKT